MKKIGSKVRINRPLAWTAVLYAAATWWGINNGFYRDFYFTVAMSFLILSLLIAVFSIIFKRFVVLLEILVLSTILFAGIYLGARAINPPLGERHIFNLVNFASGVNGIDFKADVKIGIIGKLYASPRKSPDRTYLYLEVEQVRSGGVFLPAYGKVRLTVMKNAPSLECGDKIFAEFMPKNIENFSNPGSFDYKRYLNAAGIFVRGSIKDGRAISVLREFPLQQSTIREKVEKERNKISLWIEEKGNDKDLEKIMKALLVGERWAVPKEINERFQLAGVAHLLAVSGLHLGLVASLSFFFISWLFKMSEKLTLVVDIRRISAFITFFPLLGYTLLAGGRIPTIRAFIMVSAYLFAVLIRRERDLPSTIALAGLVILLISPASIIDAGFQLSFSAVIAIAIIAPALQGWRAQKQLEERETPRWRLKFYIVSAVITTFFIILFTAPFTTRYFNQVSLLSPITNLIFIPLLGYLLLPVGLSACLFHYVIPSVGDILFRADFSILSFFMYLLSVFSNFSWGKILAPPISVLESITAMSLSAALAMSFGRTNRSRGLARLAALFLFLLFLSEVGVNYLLSKAKTPMSVTYLDVGEGNSAVIVTPSRKTIFIDAGPSWGEFDVGERIINPYLLHEQISKIDVMILTHPHEDHIGGFEWFVDNLRVGEIWTADVAYAEEFEKKVERIRWKKRIPTRKLSASSASIIFDGIEVKPFWPPGGFSSDNLNDLSLAVSLKYGKVGFIFPGDVSSNTNALLSVPRGGVSAVVLLVPHHGGKDALSQEMLKLLQYRWAVISGRYSTYFPLPAEQTLQLLKAKNIPVLRTDEMGAIRFLTDGERVQISHWDGKQMRRIEK